MFMQLIMHDASMDSMQQHHVTVEECDGGVLRCAAHAAHYLVASGSLQERCMGINACRARQASGGGRAARGECPDLVRTGSRY